MNVTKSAMSITPAQCRAARGLLNWSQDELAEATNGEVAKRSLVRFEKGGTAPQPRTLTAIRTALEAAGVMFLPPDDDGPGVRLRSPQSIFERQIADHLPVLMEGVQLVDMHRKYGSVEIDIVARDLDGREMLIEVAGSSFAVPHAAKRLTELVRSGLAPQQARLVLIAGATSALPVSNWDPRIERYVFNHGRLIAC